MLTAPFDLKKLQSHYDAAAPWRRERAYSQLCAMLRSILLEDPHRFIALIAWSDSQSLLACITAHRCEALLADAIERFQLKDDTRCAALRAGLERINAAQPRGEAVAGRSARIASRLSDAKIPVILLDDGPPPEFLVDESRLQAACALADGGVVHAAIASSGAVSSDTSFNAMLAHAVPVASGSYRLNLVGKALYRAVRAVANGVVLRDIYFLAEHLRAMNGRERSALRVALSQERREATRLEGVVEFAASLSAVEWDGSLGPKAYAGWLRRCGDLPARLRSRAQGVEATFALRGGLSHALRVLKAGGGRREALARLGGSVAGGVYALFL